MVLRYGTWQYLFRTWKINHRIEGICVTAANKFIELHATSPSALSKHGVPLPSAPLLRDPSSNAAATAPAPANVRGRASLLTPPNQVKEAPGPVIGSVDVTSASVVALIDPCSVAAAHAHAVGAAEFARVHRHPPLGKEHTFHCPVSACDKQSAAMALNPAIMVHALPVR